MQALITNVQQQCELILSWLPITQWSQKTRKLTRRKLQNGIGNSYCLGLVFMPAWVPAWLSTSYWIATLWFPEWMPHLAWAGEAQEHFSHCPPTPHVHSSEGRHFKRALGGNSTTEQIQEFRPTRSGGALDSLLSFSALRRRLELAKYSVGTAKLLRDRW